MTSPKATRWKAIVEVRQEYSIILEAESDADASRLAQRQFEQRGAAGFTPGKLLQAECWFCDPVRVGRRGYKRRRVFSATHTVEEQP